jgi:hypothetical protein
MQAHFKHFRSKRFPMIQGTLQSNEFWPLESLSKDSKVHWDSNSQSGSFLGSVRVHSLTLFCTLRSTKCDSQASLLARTLASPCLGRKPKARVTTKGARTGIFCQMERISFDRSLLGKWTKHGACQETIEEFHNILANITTNHVLFHCDNSIWIHLNGIH